MRATIAISTLSAAMLVGGCAHQQERPWHTLGEKDFAGITASTTKSDVQRLVGRPLYMMTFRNLNEEVWDYRFLNGTFPYMAEVHFDQNGRTKYYTMYRDRCFLKPIGCP